MEPRQRQRLVSLMAAMAEGEPEAFFSLLDEFGSSIAGIVRVQLRSYGRHDLLRDRDELGGLVHTAAFEILDRAGSWDPDGAPPWVWASHAIRSAVARAIGHATVELDAELLERHPAEAHHGDDGIDLARLADRYPSVRGFLDVLALASERDQHVIEQYLIQKALGDPSPSHTVGEEFGLTPANVRQIVSRLRRRAAGRLIA